MHIDTKESNRLQSKKKEKKKHSGNPVYINL